MTPANDSAIVDDMTPSRALDDNELFVRLQSMFEYRDGMLFWKRDENKPKNWNSNWPGKRAGNDDPSSGYRRIGIYGRNHLEHRLIYIMHNGPIPAGMQVDHIDGDKKNNRIENLRIATGQQNSWNSRKRSNARRVASGQRLHKGVSYIESIGKFKACIMKDGVHYYLGCYATADEASAAYQSSAKELFGAYAKVGG